MLLSEAGVVQPAESKDVQDLDFRPRPEACRGDVSQRLHHSGQRNQPSIEINGYEQTKPRRGLVSLRAGRFNEWRGAQAAVSDRHLTTSFFVG